MSRITVLAKLKSSIKVDHVYHSGIAVGSTLSCTLKPGNVHSLNAIIVEEIKDADRKK